MTTKIILLALGGACGALSRAFLHHWSVRLLPHHFNYGTLVVNCLGCFLLGIFLDVAEASPKLSVEFKMFISVGFLGALTTFSTFTADTFHHIHQDRFMLALVNVASQIILSFGCFYLGAKVAKYSIS